MRLINCSGYLGRTWIGANTKQKSFIRLKKRLLGINDKVAWVVKSNCEKILHNILYSCMRMVYLWSKTIKLISTPILKHFKL